VSANETIQVGKARRDGCGQVRVSTANAR